MSSDLFEALSMTFRDFVPVKPFCGGICQAHLNAVTSLLPFSFNSKSSCGREMTWSKFCQGCRESKRKPALELDKKIKLPHFRSSASNS